jgi:hypothetical protein
LDAETETLHEKLATPCREHEPASLQVTVGVPAGGVPLVVAGGREVLLLAWPDRPRGLRVVVTVALKLGLVSPSDGESNVMGGLTAPM